MFKRILSKARYTLPTLTHTKTQRVVSLNSRYVYAYSDKTSGARSTFWLDSAPRKPQTSQLNHDISVDTCVIGAGISGLTTAYMLAKQGQRVAVLDDGDICSGETGRTTGYLTYVIDDGLTQIQDYFGRDGAALHVESHRAAVDMVERISRQENINCQFKRVPNYWFSRKEKSEQSGQPDEDIRKEFEAMRDLGYKDIAIVNNPPNAGNDGPCIRIPGQGQFHSVAYCYGLADKIMDAGSSVYTGSKVVNWKGGRQPQVTTANGNIVNCRDVVMATNIPLQLLTTVALLESQRSYVVGGLVPKGKYEWCIFQDDSQLEDKPYNYGRFTHYDDKHDFLVVGGEDHLVGFESNFEEKYQNLEEWAKERFPDIKFTYRWSGQVQEPQDLIAYIGLDPGSSNVYIITGDSGLGLTHGTIGGMLVSDLILGNPNPWKDLYSPSRMKTKAIPDIIKHLVQVDSNYVDFFRDGDVKEVSDIIPGEGAVVCKNSKHYAVYKDEKGQVSACSAICPHLKGLVRWNSSEKSWDCPIHGSRFDKYGKTVMGPARDNLCGVNPEEVMNRK